MAFADDVFFANLPRPARDRIAATELVAEDILKRGKLWAKALAVRCPWAEPDSLLEAAAEMAEEQSRVDAAMLLFAVLTAECLENSKGDMEVFQVRLDEIGERVVEKFGARSGWLARAKRLCLAEALWKRAVAAKPSRKAKPRGRKPAESVGAAYRDLRGERSQAQMARRLGMSPDTIQPAEAESRASEKTKKKYADFERPAADASRDKSAGGGAPAAASMLQFPHRAGWFEARLHERGWTLFALKMAGGPEHRTAKKILNGDYVRDDTLGRIARALSTHPDFPQVDVRGIPKS